MKQKILDNFRSKRALTFIGCANTLAASLPNGKAHASIVAQIVPTIESTDEGVKIVDRGQGEATEQNGTGVVQRGVDLLTILADPLCSGLCSL